MGQFVFPKVEPADIQRSRRDLSLYKPFTASVGTLVPCLAIDMLPSDWMRINTNATVQTLPMVAPVKGRWKCSFDYYYNPWSNIYGYMDNNSRLATQQIVNMYRYVFKLGPVKTELFPDESMAGPLVESLRTLPKVPKGGVLDMLGCPIGYFGRIIESSGTSGTIVPTSHPAESLITYLDVVRNYYVNNQVGSVPYVSGQKQYSLDVNEQTTTDEYAEFSLQKLDELISSFRYQSANGLSSEADVNSFEIIKPWLQVSRGASINTSGEFPNISQGNLAICSQLGLFLRSYRMDLLRGIMNTSVGEFASKIDVTNGYVTMDQIYFADKLQAFINRIDITGGRFTDWIRTRWNIDAGIEVDRPIYLGSHSLWLNTLDVVATSSGTADVDSRNSSSVVGQQVGYQVGKMANGRKQRPITIKSKQYGTLMCIFSIVPDVVYSQGFELNMLKTKFADIYDPAFKQLGYQDVHRAELHAFPSFGARGHFTNSDTYDVVGKRIAWSEYMASLNRSHGDFAFGQTLDYWVNNRRYHNSDVGQIEGLTGTSLAFANSPFGQLFTEFDATTYVYPHLWNTPFADKSLSQMNYHIEVYFQIDANRALGKRLMPHL